MAVSEELARDIREALALHADPDKAERMRAYMKSAMPFHGVPKPLQRTLTHAAFLRHPFARQTTWRDAVLALWRDAACREERYAAIDLVGARQYREFRTLHTLPLFEELIVTGGWWDYADEIATGCLRELLERYPREMGAHMRGWSRDANLWKRRSAIICQNNRKEQTDRGLLLTVSDPTWRTANSSSARASVGRSAPSPGRTCTPSRSTSQAAAAESAPLASGRR